MNSKILKNFGVLNCIIYENIFTEVMLMKKFTKTLSAVMAAAVIFGTAAMPVTADKLKVTDGIIYRYDDDSNLIGEFSGWAKTDGVSRRYVDGKPYTGWLKNKDGTYKYVLDGYIVKGEMPIKNKVYTFDENGVMTGQKKAVLSLNWDEDEFWKWEGTAMLEFEITPLVYGEYGHGNPEKLERWENGEWVDCLGVENYVVTEEEYLISFQDCNQEVHIFGFYPGEYIGSEITKGTYRLTLTGINESSGVMKEDRIFKVYCIFTVPESTWIDD